MKKTDMLKKNYEFRNVLSKGKYYSGDNIEIFIKKGNNKAKNYIGIAVSVKAGKAVKRNRVKRLIREVYKEIEISIETGYCIVFLWKKKKDIENATYKTVKDDLQSIFGKIDLLKEDK